MQMIWEMMMTAFNGVKESGSYVLFYLLALGLGLIVAWDRYGNSKSPDNWMVEEAKKKIQLWPFLFGLLSLLLIVVNPVSIWILNRLSPIQGNVEKLWSLLLMLFLIAYGVVCFISLLGEQRQKNIVVVGFALLIGLAGSNYGLLSERNGEEVYESQKEAQVALYDARKEMAVRRPEAIVLAPASFLEYAGIYYNGYIRVLYGKDLYTPNLDLGIVDAYPEEFLGIYQMVENPGENLELLSEMAVLYDCSIIMLEDFEGKPDSFGSYVLMEETGDYLIYGYQ
ncbi:MAG: hypothetical protein IJP31_10235 [Lachnospiraceae bacterium]|nr:hypothetical protein [Lachnospiraceae bacterium]